MKHLLKSRVAHVVLLSIAFGAASGVLATAMTNSYLSNYALELNRFTRPLHMDVGSPKAFPTSYADAANHFSDVALSSLVSIFPKSSKTVYGYAEDASIATGVVVTSDGWIVSPLLSSFTADQLSVQIKDQMYDVTSIMIDPFTQTMFLKSAANNVSVVGFGKAFDLSTSDQLFVSPRMNQFAQVTVLEQVWQQGTVLSSDIPSRRVLLSGTSSSVNAPVFDLSGSFVGFLSKRDSQNVLIPIENMLPALNALLEKKDIRHPILGISYLDLAHAIGVADAMRRGYQTGAYITGHPAIKKGSPAALAQFMEGDIILSLNGQNLDAAQGLNDRLLSFHVGEKISILFDRNREKKTIVVVLGEEKK